MLPFHLGQEFSFSACGFDVFRTQKDVLGEDVYSYKCDIGISEVWWVQAALGAPLAPGTSQLVLQQ